MARAGSTRARERDRVSIAARLYAAGASVPHPPPSLRLYSLAKALPGILPPLRDMDADLFTELEAYAAAEAKEANAQAKRKH